MEDGGKFPNYCDQESGRRGHLQAWQVEYSLKLKPNLLISVQWIPCSDKDEDSKLLSSQPESNHPKVCCCCSCPFLKSQAALEVCHRQQQMGQVGILLLENLKRDVL